MRSRKLPKLLPPTDAEDAAITAAALGDPDNPPLTDAQLDRMRPMREVMPDLVDDLIRRQRGGRPRRGQGVSAKGPKRNFSASASAT